MSNILCIQTAKVCLASRNAAGKYVVVIMNHTKNRKYDLTFYNSNCKYKRAELLLDHRWKEKRVVEGQLRFQPRWNTRKPSPKVKCCWGWSNANPANLPQASALAANHKTSCQREFVNELSTITTEIPNPS